MTKNGIAWQSDLDVKFNNPANGTPGIRVRRFCTLLSSILLYPG